MKKSTAKTIGCSFLLLVSLAFSSGCAVKGGQGGTSDSTAGRDGYDFGGSAAVDKRVRDYLAANDPKAQSVLIRTAKSALGTPYVRGGTSTNGFDCSGFVQWTYNQVGIKLPRTAREQSQVGHAIRNVDDLQVGDIVAFRHPKRGYHTGIYVGDGKFIHSPRKRTTVRINNLDDPYFSGTFLGARRVQVSNEADIAAAEKMLADYRMERSKSAPATASLSSGKKGKKGSILLAQKGKDTRKTQTVAERSSKSASSKAEKASVKTSSKTASKEKASVKKASAPAKNAKATSGGTKTVSKKKEPLLKKGAQAAR